MLPWANLISWCRQCVNHLSRLRNGSLTREVHRWYFCAYDSVCAAVCDYLNCTVVMCTRDLVLTNSNTLFFFYRSHLAAHFICTGRAERHLSCCETSWHASRDELILCAPHPCLQMGYSELRLSFTNRLWTLTSNTNIFSHYFLKQRCTMIQPLCPYCNRWNDQWYWSDIVTRRSKWPFPLPLPSRYSWKMCDIVLTREIASSMRLFFCMQVWWWFLWTSCE